MTLTTFSVASAVTPTVVKTCVSHYANRKPRKKKPTAHISYDEGLQLIRSFLIYASHKTVDELQAFTAQWVPTPTWVKTENVQIPAEHVSKAADAIIEQLGPDGVQAVGGTTWWQWRRNDSVLQAEWIEMSSHYTERKRENKKSRRIMLYVHGGGYFFGSVDEHRYQMQRHARKLKARVLAPRYRLAPQFPFPCGLQDCLAVYLFLLTQQEPNEIILAGDSAGGGMVVSMLCLLRDRGLPLPAGAVLISPWVDLTHSFPSVAEENPMDYIPAHGFHHRPSVAWPPPNDDDMDLIQKAMKTQTREEAFMVKTTDVAAKLGVTAPDQSDPSSKVANRVPAPNHFLSIELDDKVVVIKEQIQMYATNQLLSHPLVSPILQPSLGGLPPLLFLVGGGEMLRDEQIYLAHKAANPRKYPLSDIYKIKYDPEDRLLNKYKATPVQLQVWEDLCHVAPTLSFTRPAKYMYRSIAQFGAWALARAQERPIEIMDDDNISIISTESNSERPGESTDSIAQMKNAQDPQPRFVGRAGDSLPFFHNHMIRQLVDRYGNISDLPSADVLPATTMDVNEIGLIKPGPVKKWMEAKNSWASRYASSKRKVQKQRIEAIRAKKNVAFGEEERPPPSALAARRTAREVQKKQRKSYGLAMWSMWGSKHDEATIKREDEMERDEHEAQASEPAQAQVDDNAQSSVPVLQEPASVKSDRASRRSLSRGSRSRALSSVKDGGTRSRSRRRTISVTDKGQLYASVHSEDGQPALMSPPSRTSHHNEDVPVTSVATANPASPPRPTASHPSYSSAISATANAPPLFLPKFRNATHLHSPSNSRDIDTMSTRTGNSAISTSGASTRAVFSVPGISKVATNATSDGTFTTITAPSGTSEVNGDVSPVAAADAAPDSSPPSTQPYSTATAIPEQPAYSSSRTPTPTITTAAAAADAAVANTASTSSHTHKASQSSLSPPSSSLLSTDFNGTSAVSPTDTPVSRRSLERLRTHNLEYEMEQRAEEEQSAAAAAAAAARRTSMIGSGGGGGGEDGAGNQTGMARDVSGASSSVFGEGGGGAAAAAAISSDGGFSHLQPLRSPNSVAVVGAEGVVGVVRANKPNEDDDNEDDADADAAAEEKRRS